MAGDITERIDFLKTTVSYAVLTGGAKDSMGEQIQKAYLKGPAIDQKAYFRWAKQNYQRGMPTASVTARGSVPTAPVLSVLPPAPPGMETVVSQALIENADVSLWAHKHILENRPEKAGTNWVCSYESFTNTLTITYPDSTFDVISLVFTDSEPDYLVVFYYYRPVGYVETPDETVPRMFIYKMGSGNGSLDVLSTNITAAPEFFPIIPLRLNNLPISHSSFSTHYKSYERAYKKATGAKLADTLDSIDDNPNVGDIDYAFMVMGVELNTTENIGKRYIYEFLQQLREAEENMVAVDLWLNKPTRRLPQSNTLNLKSNQIPAYNVRINWLAIREERRGGLGKPGAKKGDLWFEKLPDIVSPPVINDNPAWQGIFNFLAWRVPRCKLFWQDEDASYKSLTIIGLEHINYVYGTNSVRITSTEALDDTDESGFIIPLHYPSLSKLPLKDATQLALSNRYLVFNCFTVTKVRWYQRGIFKVIFAIVIAIVSALLFPQAIGLLGANAAVGASLGFSGLTATIVGAAVNAIAAMVLMTVIEAGAVAIFGEKWGTLIGSLVSFVAMSYVMNFQTTGSWSVNWGDMLKADNLLKLLDTASNSVAAWARGELGSISEEMKTVSDDFKKTSEELEKRALELLGTGGAFIDPLMFGKISDSSTRRFSYAESSESFLSRTLMTGSDIAELSTALIEDYTTIALKLPSAIS